MNTRRYWLIVLVLASVVVPIYLFYSRAARRTPKGQQSFVFFESRMIPVFQQDFNKSDGRARLVILCPTGRTDLAAALQKSIAEHRDWRARVFLFWQPDETGPPTPPATPALALVPDTRVSQFWDPERAIGKALNIREAALYSGSATWGSTPPQPDWTGPIGGLDKALSGL